MPGWIGRERGCLRTWCWRRRASICRGRPSGSARRVRAVRCRCCRGAASADGAGRARAGAPVGAELRGLRLVWRGALPLGEELGLRPGALRPSLLEDLVHLGTWMPFAHAAKEVARCRRVAVSEATATRQTEPVGAAWVALQTGEVERLEREQPEPPPARPCSR